MSVEHPDIIDITSTDRLCRKLKLSGTTRSTLPLPLQRLIAVPGGGMSAKLMVRLTGLIYLLIFIVAPSGAQTATPLRMTVTLLCDVCVALLLYTLLRSVNRTVSSLAAAFRLLFVLVMGITALNYFGITHLFQPSRAANAFNAGYGWSLVPFGAHCVLVGWLVWKSKFLPKTLGVLMALAGAAYLMFLSPQTGARLFFPWLAICGVMGEGSLTLWFLFLGIKTKSADGNRIGLSGPSTRKHVSSSSLH
jgi:Domain of unknown function (DUF4386)